VRREVEKIGISDNAGESVGPCIVRNRFFRGVPRQTGVEHVNRIGEKLCETANELRREIRVKQQLQRYMRSRPAYEA
jgi:hypothetical protein